MCVPYFYVLFRRRMGIIPLDATDGSLVRWFDMPEVRCFLAFRDSAAAELFWGSSGRVDLNMSGMYDLGTPFSRARSPHASARGSALSLGLFFLPRGVPTLLHAVLENSFRAVENASTVWTKTEYDVFMILMCRAVHVEP